MGVFSLTFIFGSIFLKPYIGLTLQERNFIVIVGVINLIFCTYYLWEIMNLEKVFKLETKNIIKFGKRIGIITLLYLPHLFLVSSLFFRELHNLELMMVFLIVIMEVTLIVLVLKEVYDLLFLEETRRNFEIEENRKKYLEKENTHLPRERF